MIDYTALVRHVIADAARCVPALAHLQPGRIAVLAAARGGRGRCGNLATCHGLRGAFTADEENAMERIEPADASLEAAQLDNSVDAPNLEAPLRGDAPSLSHDSAQSLQTASPALLSGIGAPTFSIWTRGRRSRRAIAVSEWFRFRWPRFVSAEGLDCHYMIALRLPRMLLHDPLDTIFHELHHIGAQFDGRLSPARHGPVFDRAVRYLVNEWRKRGEPELVRRASLSFDELEKEFGAVVAECAPPGLTLPLIEAAPAPEPYESAVPRVHPGYALMRGYEMMPSKLSPPAAPLEISPRTLRLRHMTREGAVALPRALAVYARRNGATAR